MWTRAKEYRVPVPPTLLQKQKTGLRKAHLFKFYLLQRYAPLYLGSLKEGYVSLTVPSSVKPTVWITPIILCKQNSAWLTNQTNLTEIKSIFTNYSRSSQWQVWGTAAVILFKKWNNGVTSSWHCQWWLMLYLVATPCLRSGQLSPYSTHSM